ncbi:hypothetical protein Bpfe_029096 [Biomphalaria pfeifferi]|uniref:Uncharacterized protein n=1 Tax=Biomphalaria pfeifferi TaxID=112525 RepID=A0AAD8ATD0_BIOPF|nr:hypothetical protein Bpfe_029096 [Biomphalaria pfeifferi]
MHTLKPVQWYCPFIARTKTPTARAPSVWTSTDVLIHAINCMNTGNSARTIRTSTQENTCLSLQLSPGPLQFQHTPGMTYEGLL